MFGHDDKKDNDDKHEEKTVVPDNPTVGSAIHESDQASQAAPNDDDSSSNSTAPDAASVSDDDAWQHPGEPIEDEPADSDPAPINDIIAPAGGAKPATHLHSNFPASDFSNDDENDGNEHIPHELIDIKQKALGELTPLIDKLDQSPEDRFRTLMMMIQASDDQKLLKEAYEAAENIKDEKTRGQALLDIVNEINYFTQHPEQ